MGKPYKFVISVEGTTLTKDEKTTLGRSDVGGVVLYGRNILGYDTTKFLVGEIKSIDSNLKICVDEEGGVVSRFSHLFPNYSQSYCSTLSESEVRAYYKKRSAFLKAIEIDVNFAPVVDIAFSENSVMYKRSYGSSVESVISLAAVCIEEQRRAGIETCLKHFPGHGKTLVDSHEELSVVDISLEEWLGEEGEVFRKLIKKEPEYIMVGHILFPQIDKKPASSSDRWVNDVLRDRLGFKGKVVVDDVQMKGFSGEINGFVDYVIDTEKLF